MFDTLFLSIIHYDICFKLLCKYLSTREVRDHQGSFMYLFYTKPGNTAEKGTLPTTSLKILEIKQFICLRAALNALP